MAGKVALITGAAKGLGKEFCRVLLNRGAKVCVADVDRVKGQETALEFCDAFGKDSVFFTKCDVTKKEELETAFATTKNTYGQLDIVCNNAGIIHEGRWQTMLDINLVAVIHGSNLALKYMGANEGGKGGVIVNVSSLAGLSPMTQAPVYSASKHGVLGFTRALAGEYRTHRVRANCLCPSFTDTDILQTAPGALLYDDPLDRSAVQGVDIVGKAFLQLVEDESKNGVVLMVFPTKGIREKKYNDLQFYLGLGCNSEKS